MPVLGRNCYVFECTGRSVEVFGYDPVLGSAQRDIVSGCFAYDEPTSGRVIILTVHQGLEVPTMDYSLIPPFFMRMNNITVNECPKSLMQDPTEEDHAVIVCHGDNDTTIIPLLLRGAVSFIPVRRPTKQEAHDLGLERIELTFQSPEWDPSLPNLERMEDLLSSHEGRLKATGDRKSRDFVLKNSWISDVTLKRLHVIGSKMCSQTTATLSSISNTLDEWDLSQSLQRMAISGVATSNKRRGITAERLAKNWNILIERARKTIEATTQCMIRAPAGTKLVRRFRTNDRMLRYRRLNMHMFTDTMESKITLKRQNKYAQVFVVPPAWVEAFPMRRKSEAHEALPLLLHKYGAPIKMIMDDSKEQMFGEFDRKLKDADVISHPIEPYSPWQDLVELMIRELKKSSRRLMAMKAVRKRLWDDALEWEATIKRHMYHYSLELQGEVPETLMISQTADISALAEIGFFDWVWWYDEPASFPDEKRKIGRYLGPSCNHGSEMCSKIFKANGNTRHTATFVALTDDKMQDTVSSENAGSL
jgi:hypothetical protein